MEDDCAVDHSWLQEAVGQDPERTRSQRLAQCVVLIVSNQCLTLCIALWIMCGLELLVLALINVQLCQNVDGLSSKKKS